MTKEPTNKARDVELAFYDEHGREAINSIWYSCAKFNMQFLDKETKNRIDLASYMNFFNNLKTPDNKYDYYRLLIGTLSMGYWVGFSPIYADLQSFHDMREDKHVHEFQMLKDIKEVCNTFWTVELLGGTANDNLQRDYPFIHDWTLAINNKIKDKIQNLGITNNKRKVYQDLLDKARRDLFHNISLVREGKSNIIDIKDEVEYWSTRVDFEI